jgi:transposase-like protein
MGNGTIFTVVSINRFSHKRNEAAYPFLRRSLRYYDIDCQPKPLNTDKHSSYANPIARLEKEEQLLLTEFAALA